ncbi:MAG: S-adenosylmethionine:tRNA ribosyltransferase-isomerase [Bacteroidales bacterium]|nr:S-adenosylmethionine:tRNA ribosyltransferase-isomerase [Bacteroidales bacterium]
MKPIADISPHQFSYDLPDDRIALFPDEYRDNSRILIRNGDGSLQQDTFRNLASYLPGDSHVFLNNSKVIPARLVFTKETGSRVELFCLRPINPADYVLSLSATEYCTWECMVGNLKRFTGSSLEMNVNMDEGTVVLRADKVSLAGNIAIIRFSWDKAIRFGAILYSAGQTPLPPYIKRETTELDRQRYQTVYSKYDGSVAAPTAGLHFTEYILDQLQQKNIHCHELTLHIGAGTFQPMKSEKIRDHKMHAETFRITADLIHTLAGMEARVICVGTTSVRALESLYWLGVKIIQSGGRITGGLQLDQWEVYDLPRSYSMKEAFGAFREWIDEQDAKELFASTKIMIVPGYEFRVTDTLITNFHQPQSTLLLLIAAFIGDSWRDVYRYALDQDFRFLSYGDSSLLFQ